MKCDECGGETTTDEVRGEVICMVCSLIVEQTMDILPSTDFESTRRDTGLLLTRFYNERRDANGTSISNRTHDRMRRLAWLDQHVSRRKDRSIGRLFLMVTDICQKLEMMNTRDRAFYLVKQAYARKTMHQEFSLLVGSAIMLAAQEASVFINMDTMLRVLSISRQQPQRQLSRAYREMKRMLNMNVQNSPEMKLPLVAEKLKLDMDIITEARNILKVPTNAMVRHRPEIELAVAVYVAAVRKNKRLTQTAVAEACKTSDLSMRVLLRKRFTTEALNSTNVNEE